LAQLKPRPPPRTLVTVATYNEIENLPARGRHLAGCPADRHPGDRRQQPRWHRGWCDERSAAEPRLFCLHRAGKLGLGTATIAAMQYAIEHHYDFVLNMDADFSHHPRYIRRFWLASIAPMSQSLALLPWRRDERLAFKAPLHELGRQHLRPVLLGLKPKDTSGAFRCYRVALLKQLDFTKIKSRGYSFQEEILWRLKRLGARMTETPIVFADRERGQSKINKREAFAAIWVIFRLGLRIGFGCNSSTVDRVAKAPRSRLARSGDRASMHARLRARA